ncbi:histidine--tRNA ligase [bacterium]|jgi:histidyl-tRNA synthetase|nr:histidine--tRNA ligase [bacterium]MBT6996474.1 histidine--tRNA ligase [bacterium]MBT7772508.1 histidine--tRNA ligase [bacterium]
MRRKFNAPTGTADLLPDDHDFFTFVKKVIRHRFRQSGFRRIEVPIFEETELFERSLGVDSEIIKREIYSFTDPRDRDFSLRPEMTSGVVRAFLEHKMYEGPLPVELYYVGRCFRFERPKSRTQREFWQFGAEVIGESDPAIDAQIIYLGHRILSDLGIREHCELKINTIGSVEDREKYLDALANFYAGKERSLSPTGREKLEQKKYLDLLDPRTEDEEVLAKMAPKITEFLSPDSQEFFDQMLSYLNSFGIEYTIDPTLIRPLQYYSQTTFEFRKKDSREKILVGGRYDGLGKKIGHEKVLGGCGFAAGMERTIALMKEAGVEVPHKDSLQIFVAATGIVAKKHALPILVKLREHGFHAVGVLGKTSMEEQLNRARKFNVPYTILMGDLEIKKNEVIVRDMKKGKSETICADNIVPHLEKLLGGALDSTDDFLPVKK